MQSQVYSSCLILLVLEMSSVGVVADLYDIVLKTQNRLDAGTEAHVSMTIFGNERKVKFQLMNPRGRPNRTQHRRRSNWYDNVNAESVGIICGVMLHLTRIQRAEHNWYPESVMVLSHNTAQAIRFDVTGYLTRMKPSITDAVPINGNWSEWGVWSNLCVCNGTRKRSRMCDNPKPGCTGAHCPGNDTMEEDCVRCTSTTTTSTTSMTTSTSSTMTSTTPTLTNTTTSVDTRSPSLTGTPRPHGKHKEGPYASKRYFTGYVLFVAFFVMSLICMTIGMCVHRRTKKPPSSKETKEIKATKESKNDNNDTGNVSEIVNLPSNPQVIVS